MHDVKTIRCSFLVPVILMLAPLPILAQGVPWQLLEGADELGAAHREVVGVLGLATGAASDLPGNRHMLGADPAPIPLLDARPVVHDVVEAFATQV